MKRIIIGILCVVLAFLCVGCSEWEQERLKQEAEEEAERIAEEEERRIERIIEASADEVSPADYEEWREYHEFEISMVADDSEAVDSKYLDKIGYCAPYAYMGGLRADEDLWLIYDGVSEDLYMKLHNAQNSEEFDAIFNEKVNGKIDAMVYEGDGEGWYEYAWDIIAKG